MALDFILERYNYWIVIILMMTGLYIVISRGNLVKKIVGLNIFQTSVFIYYISIGKIFGGTAPILIGGGGEEHGPDPSPEEASAFAESPPTAHAGVEGLHTPPPDIHAAPGAANDLAGAVAASEPGPDSAVENLHTAPQTLPKSANDLSTLAPPETGDAIVKAPPETHDPSFVITPPDAAHAADPGAVGAGAHDVLHQAAEIIYSNPLPHVLILTAIVVGVATTAVGLALAVRIREAYGSVEEDELEAADNIAEFGRDLENGARA